MGKRAVDIVGLDVEKLIELLNAALSEEWLAYYQYWIGAKVAAGPMREEIAQELAAHADEELGHAGMVAERILQLGGTPLLDPKEWFTHTGCKYEAPEDPYVEALLRQNIAGERCAIDRYQQLAAMTEGKDFTTHAMAVKILGDELEHEDDLENYLTDIAMTKAAMKKG